MTAASVATFDELGLPQALLQALREAGYAAPSPIQASTIPVLLAGRDVLGQARTGTGKTAAFALPVLARLEVSAKRPQALVLVPTRELALQVAEAFRSYASHLPGVEVLAIYGGQNYAPQFAALEQGVQVVVGTPGRVIDHLERGTLVLRSIKTLVLDEADEMLRMGFAEDLARILRDVPTARQTALFSATLPESVRAIAGAHLRDPAEVTVESSAPTADTVRQRYWQVSGMNKLDALVRIIEAEPVDAMIVFTRTKEGTKALAESLQDRGVAAEAINSDLPQGQRERLVSDLKRGRLYVLVATDVAARGLDVDRVTHVVNFDMPASAESYAHRIGRTGRAGRSGEAITFITAHERELLRSIERVSGHPIEAMKLPSTEALNTARIARFKVGIAQVLAEDGHAPYAAIIEDFVREYGVAASDVAAAVVAMAQEGIPLMLELSARERRAARLQDADDVPDEGNEADDEEVLDEEPVVRSSAPEVGRGAPEPAMVESSSAMAPARGPEPAGFITWRIEVGHTSGIKSANLLAALARECQVEARLLGRLQMFDIYSIVELPADLPKKRLKHLLTAKVTGQALRIRATDERIVEGKARG
jgi:ATP-dependent RNA helicase DeaD